MPGPILCGLPSQAPLLPKLRGHFAEFLNNASPAGLRILSSSTCVGLRYGYSIIYSSFSRRMAHILHYLFFAPLHASGLMYGFSCTSPPALAPDFPLPANAFLTCPYSSVILQYRNFNLLSIGYALRPRLRSRLTQGRSALPWNPWIFGLKDSHFNLATHSGILSSWLSTVPSETAASCQQCSSANTCVFLSFGVVFQPRTFSAQDLSTSELLRTLLMCGCL